MATDEEFMRFSCRIFKGCVITVSGLDNEERKEVKRAVDSEGRCTLLHKSLEHRTQH